MQPIDFRQIAERKVKNLKKSELVRLCRAIGLNQYGVKAILIAGLADWAKESSENYQRLVIEVSKCYDYLHLPAQNRSAPYSIPGNALTPPANNPNLNPPLPDIKDVYFEPSLYYNVVRTIEVKRFNWTNNNNLYKCPFRLQPNDLVLLDTTDPGTGLKLHKVFFGVGFLPSTSNTHVKLEFHDSAQLRLNNQSVPIIGSYKKPNSKKPGDLTPHLYKNGINDLTFISYGVRRPIVLFVMLVQEIPDTEIAQSLKQKSFVSKEDILKERQAQKDLEHDVVAGVETITLKDPYTRAKLTTPTRAKTCKHKQCFEATTFYSLNRSVPTWECPVCYKVINPTDLIVDGYMDEIVQKTDDNVDSIIINPDGSWELPGQTTVNVISNDKTPIKNVVNIDDEVALIQTNGPKIARTPKTPKQIEIINISDSDDEPLPTEKRRLARPIGDDYDDIVQSTTGTGISHATNILHQTPHSNGTSEDEYIDDDIPMRELLGIRGMSTSPAENSQSNSDSTQQIALPPFNFNSLTTPVSGVEISRHPKLPTVFVSNNLANLPAATPTLTTPVSTNIGIAHSPSLSPTIGSNLPVANTPLSQPLTPVRPNKDVPDISNFNPIFKLVKDKVAEAVRRSDNGTLISPDDFLDTPPPSNQITLDTSGSVLSSDIIRPNMNTLN